MKIIITLLYLLFASIVKAGAPAPKDLSLLPKGPHTFNNITSLSIGVEWDEAFISEFLHKSNEYRFNKPITGGISAIKVKNNNVFSNFSGSYIWVDVLESDSNKMARLVISGIYGPDNLITDVMKFIYNFNVYNGYSKFILINDKASVRTYVSKKNVLNILLENTNQCEELSGKFKTFSINSNNIISKSFIEWNSVNVCKANTKAVEFKGFLKDYKINKLLWANIADGKNFIINKIKNK